MKKATTQLLALLVFLRVSLPESVQAQEIQIVDYGIYTGRVVNVSQDLRSPTGRRRALEADLLRQTDVIPAVLNTRFGFRFKVMGVSEGTNARLRLRFDYPEMKDPATGKVSSSYEALGDCPASPELLGMYWDFVHPWEMGAGKWTLSIYSGDHLLARRSLTVVKGEESGSGKTGAKTRTGEPDGAANRSQPVGSETNRTPSAAGAGG